MNYFSTIWIFYSFVIVIIHSINFSYFLYIFF